MSVIDVSGNVRWYGFGKRWRFHEPGGRVTTPGAACALSGDMALVSAPHYPTNVDSGGVIYVFQKVFTDWSQRKMLSATTGVTSLTKLGAQLSQCDAETRQGSHWRSGRMWSLRGLSGLAPTALERCSCSSGPHRIKPTLRGHRLEFLRL